MVLPYIDTNPSQVYMSSQPWTPLPPPCPYYLSGSSHTSIKFLKKILVTSSGKFYLKQKRHNNRDQVLFPYNWHQRINVLRYTWLNSHLGFPGDSDGKEPTFNVGDMGLIPGVGRSPEEGKGYPLQYSGPGEFHGLRSLAGYSTWGCKELDRTGLLSNTHKQSFRNQNSHVNFMQQDCKSQRIPIICPGICKDYFQNTEGDIF